MKRNIFMTMLILIMSTYMFAQYQTVDFETGGLGAEWGWTVGENGDNPPLEFVSNPSASGVNTSATVAQFNARAAGMSWALCYTDDINTFEFNASNSTLSIMVYKTVISPVALKFEGGSTPVEVQVTNTVTNQWETLTFDFSSAIGSAYGRLVVIPDFVDRTEDRVIYFDNIVIPTGNTNPPAEPETAAPTPTYDAANVISLFSNAYTNVTVDTWSADWDNAAVSDVQIDGNDTKLYTSMTFAGIEFISETIDATSMQFFHMDLWTPDDTSAPAVFNVKLVDFGADGAYGGGDDVEHEISFGSDVMDTETWVGLDIPMSDFTGLTTKAHLAQLIISGDPNTIYIDNIYFRSGNSTPDMPEVAAPSPTYNEDAVISLFCNEYTNVAVDMWSAEWDQANVGDVQIQGNDTKLYTGITYAGIEFISHMLNITSMTHFHMDIWTPDAIDGETTFAVKLVDFGADGAYGGGDDVEHEVSFDNATLQSQTWIGLDMDLDDFTSLTTREHVAQLVITSDPNTVYIDNIYFRDDDQDADDDAIDASSALYSLGNNYPNPFNPVTNIKFSINKPGHVSLKVYDVKGRLVETLVNDHREAATYDVVWNAEGASSGVYFYSLTVNNGAAETKRMILLK